MRLTEISRETGAEIDEKGEKWYLGERHLPGEWVDGGDGEM